jgi:ribosomal protein S18 acetylase RimI-like enzyme
MTFREIIDADVPELFVVRAATRENTISVEDLRKMGITEESVLGMLKSTHRGWLCKADGRVVGFTMGNRETGEMWVIAILPEYEDKGIGGRLLTLVEDWLWSVGWDEIWLTTDTDPTLRAYGFYRRQGWRDSEIKDDLRYMVKKNPSNL